MSDSGQFDDSIPPRRSREAKLGPFSIGDLIAILGIVFATGATWVRIDQNTVDIKDVGLRVKNIEQSLPYTYVRRDEYREDIREIKGLLRDINERLNNEAETRMNNDKRRSKREDDIP